MKDLCNMTTGNIDDLFITQGYNSNTNHKLQEDSYRDKGLFVKSSKKIISSSASNFCFLSCISFS